MESFRSIKHQRYLNHLERQVQKYPKTFGGRLGAMLVYKNKPIAVAPNSWKSDPFQAHFAKQVEAIFLHAELNALKQGIKYLNTQHDYEAITKDELRKCTMYILRLASAGPPGDMHWVRALAKPCEACQAALATFGIKTVIYTNYNEEWDIL